MFLSALLLSGQWAFQQTSERRLSSDYSTHLIWPCIQDGGRVVNVCSMAGKLSIIKSEALLSRFVNAGSAGSASDVEALATKFVDDVRAGRSAAPLLCSFVNLMV